VLTHDDLRDAIMEGVVERVRPKMMTVVAIMAGLLPIMWSTGAGSEITQRIAVPMIGGMISSTPLALIVFPAIFGLVKGLRLPSGDPRKPRPPEALIAAIPYKIHTVLTDNGIQFMLVARQQDASAHVDMRCQDNGIEHRLANAGTKHP
jgi:hypothetical protein